METFRNDDSEEAVSENSSDETLRLRAECERFQNLYLRTLADLDNFRKRVQQEQARATQAGKRDILLKILEVLDNFDRALEETTGLPDSLTEGFEAIHRQLLSLLQTEGVTAIESLGQVFDPACHEAVATAGNPQPGFRHHRGGILSGLSMA